jgi:hypothetical protein
LKQHIQQSFDDEGVVYKYIRDLQAIETKHKKGETNLQVRRQVELPDIQLIDVAISIPKKHNVVFAVIDFKPPDLGDPLIGDLLVVKVGRLGYPVYVTTES